MKTCPALLPFIFLLIMFSLSIRGYGQKIHHVGFSLGNNAIAMPLSGVGGIVHIPFHPAFQVHAGHAWRQREQSLWSQEVYLGYTYQRVVHHVAHLYTEGQGSWKLYNGLWGGAGLGLGYAHQVNTADNKVFELNKEGRYERTHRWGQPKFMASTSIHLNYRIAIGSKGDIAPYLRYQFWMLAPYVKSYVPLLPNALLHIGFTFTPKNL